MHTIIETAMKETSIPRFQTESMAAGESHAKKPRGQKEHSRAGTPKRKAQAYPSYPR